MTLFEWGFSCEFDERAVLALVSPKERERERERESEREKDQTVRGECVSNGQMLGRGMWSQGKPPSPLPLTASSVCSWGFW
jgi:hypothetical protein